MPYRQSADPHDVLRPYLGPHEEVLWRGQPPQGVRFLPSDAVVVPLSILWTGGALLWSLRTPRVLLPLGLVFVLFGVYFGLIRFLIDAQVRARTVYAVTDERVLILTGLRRHRLIALPLRRLPPMKLDTRHDGGGEIRFGSHPVGGAGPGRWPGVPSLGVPLFELEDDVERIYRVILEARDRAT